MEARRIRVLFSDPDATDSDSGDDATSSAYTTTKSAGKTQIVIFHGNGSTGAKIMNPAGCSRPRAQAVGLSPALATAAGGRNCATVDSASGKRHRGVYERQPGRWAAEFRSHRLKVRHWIGTFATEDEAKAAYDAFEKQFLLSPPPPRCGLPATAERDRHAGGVRRASRHPPDEKRQIVLALTTARLLPSPAGAKKAASVSAAAPPCVSSSSAMEAAISSVSSVASSAPAPAWPFRDARAHDDGDAPPSLHSLWADEPADEDFIGLADLAHLPLPFSDAKMEFDPADLSLFDNGFL